MNGGVAELSYQLPQSLILSTGLSNLKNIIKVVVLCDCIEIQISAAETGAGGNLKIKKTFSFISNGFDLSGLDVKGIGTSRFGTFLIIRVPDYRTTYGSHRSAYATVTSPYSAIGIHDYLL